MTNVNQYFARQLVRVKKSHLYHLKEHEKTVTMVCCMSPNSIVSPRKIECWLQRTKFLCPSLREPQWSHPLFESLETSRLSMCMELATLEHAVVSYRAAIKVLQILQTAV